MRSGGHNREVVFERRSITQDPIYGTRVESGWAAIATVFAEVQDMLPSKGERLADGVSVRLRPCRIRMMFRDDLDTAMRIRVKGRGPDEADRLLRITAGPAELGYRKRIEWVAEELSTEGHEP